MNTIAIAYEAEDTRPGWKVRLLAYAFTAGAVIGVVAITLIVAILPLWLDRLALGSAATLIIQVVRLPLMGLLFAGGLTVLYRYGPDRSPKTPWRNVGAVVGTLLFILFSFLFSIYSANIGAMPASYGLLGSVAALMIFLQLTSLAVIVGAEVNAVRETSVVEPTTVQETSVATGAPAALATGAQPTQPTTPMGMGKAVAGFIALYLLGRQQKP